VHLGTLIMAILLRYAILSAYLLCLLGRNVVGPLSLWGHCVVNERLLAFAERVVNLKDLKELEDAAGSLDTA
jgi:hypothetical protein